MASVIVANHSANHAHPQQLVHRACLEIIYYQVVDVNHYLPTVYKLIQ